MSRCADGSSETSTLSIEWIPVSRDENFLSANMLGYYFQMLSFSGTRPPGNGAQLLCMTFNTTTVSVLTTNTIQKLSETKAKTNTFYSKFYHS